LSDCRFPNGSDHIVAANNNDIDLLQIVKSYYALSASNDVTVMISDLEPMVRAKKHDQLATTTPSFLVPPLMGFRAGNRLPQ